MGYILLQKGEKEGQYHIIRCGSRSNTDTEKNYSVCELELLGVVFAIQDCKFYLKGCPHFTIQTDHKPLLGILKKKN